MTLQGECQLSRGFIRRERAEEEEEDGQEEYREEADPVS